MLEVQVCVGSSCHMKGSYPIIRQFESLLQTHNLSAQVVLKAAFCLGQCTKGVAILVDGQPVTGLTVSNAENFFTQHVLSRFVSPKSGKEIDNA